MESELFTQKIETLEAEKHFENYYSNDVIQNQQSIISQINSNNHLELIDSKKRILDSNENENENDNTKKIKK